MDELRVVDDWGIAEDLWQAIALLIPKHVNTHRFGGGNPRFALAFRDRATAYAKKGDKVRAKADHDQATRLDSEVEKK